MVAASNRTKDRSRAHEVAGLLLILLSVVSLASIVSYDAGDATWFTHQPQDQPTRNWFGRIGATVAEALIQVFGATSFALPFFVGAFGWTRVRRMGAPLAWSRVAGYALLVLLLCALLDLLFGPIAYGGERFTHPGGFIGLLLASPLEALLNRTGAILVCIAALGAIMILTTRFSFVRAGAWTGTAFRQAATWTAARWREFRETRAARARAAARRRPSPPPARKDRPATASEAPGPERPRPTIRLEPAEDEIESVPAPEPAPRQVDLPLERGSRGFSVPPIDLLNEPEQQGRETEEELLERAGQITDKLREFAIDGSVVAIHPGPVVTTFEFKPEAGVKYSKITGMTDDLSLALRAESVRIDRMAGRSTVGIEVPNRRQATIFPRELIGDERFANTKSKLALALGKDIHGEVYIAELDRMPHLLIAGATGAGKSVGLNGMIVSMLYKATPEDLRFIMIDTKMIELGIYAGIPHLLIPVVTDPKHASTALKWAVKEMEQRYHRLAAVGVRNIAQFNALIEEEPDRTIDDPKTGEGVPLSHLPYIVIVIDEMADLMMVSAADVEESVMRLAQMARAVGIHLILATQRPSVDVITGTIKANFPSRVAFRVSQRVDSRTIIDQQGAEHLLGRGDMLFLPTGSSRLIRMHSGFITETEINRITTYLKKMAEPAYDETVLEERDESAMGVDPGDRDEMFVDAVRTVLNEGKCSITLIQRRLQLGYARAARIVDMMEHEGVVSPGEGSKPREVLVGPEYLDTFDS